ncbi:hypothetical protein BC343_07550 [Mucilaginibacter pedocola]|uniref:Uncharacterized protein n=1 Tax=Mucilaginibacter pedocola TaxID=1792845 RepID=A0A1S9PC08_9SPHI|nr:hypothetical protein BC343_07550 [Mucilaginibacter pedocola]
MFAYYIAVGLRIIPSITAITASTSNIFINPPTVVKKKPTAQPITRMTAMVYNNEFMVVDV